MGIHRYQGVKVDSCICNYCGVVLKNRYDIKRHILKHEDPEAYYAKIQCTECGKLVRNGYTMQHHLKIHQENKIGHTCPHCNKKASSSTTLKQHIKYVHVLKKTHQCRFCEKAFDQPLELTVRI